MRINGTYIESEPHVIAGRVGIVMGIFAFACVYALIMIQFGWIAGIAIGWLPSAAAAWLTALGCDSLVTHLLPSSHGLRSATPKH